MPMWPFGRRGGKAAKSKEGRPTAAAASAHEAPSSDALRRTPSRRSSRRKRRSSRSTASMRDVEKGPLGAPFDDQQPARRLSSSDDITALPQSKRLEQSPHLRPVTNEHGIPYNFQPNSLSQASLPTARERGRLQRPQSLRKPQAESAILRRKSSKRKEHDLVREEEIRAMSLPLPQKRPAGNSGGMLRRDSKKVKGALNRHFERPTSNISLPLEESIHSSMSGSSETRAWRVSALDMFSPRPTVRCSVGSQYYYNGARTSPGSCQDKIEARRDRPATTSRDSKPDRRSSRIDDLADTLDAGALREILERDKRRRERKRKADEERLRRRLERRAEKQKAAEQGGTPATPRREARGAVGLGIEKDTLMPMEDVRPSTPQLQAPLQRLETVALAPKTEENSQLPTPVESPIEEPVVASAQAVRLSRASMPSPSPQAHTRGPSNVSEMPALLSEMAARDTPVESVEPAPDPNTSGSLHPVETADTAATSKKGSSRRRSSEGRRLRVFASLFMRGKRTSQDQARTTPSEISFSNTSRESMSRQPPPAHLVAPLPTQPTQLRRPPSVPHRTMSKFREDLPEFPLSPPDSRVQSPEVASSSAIAVRRQGQPPPDLRVDSTNPGPGGRTDSPVSPGVPATGLMSQSLASVDSEGSWLSGKPIKRRSNKSHMRSSVGSSTAAMKRNEEFNASYEELGIPDDEYFKRLTPQPDDHSRSTHSADLLARKASSTAMAAADDAAPDLDDEELPPEAVTPEEELVKSGVGRQPTIVHRQPRVKSTEGLLSYFQAGKSSPEDEKASTLHSGEPTEQDSPTSEGEPVVFQRAKSVDLGKNHSRQLSAGSAKLLDIPARRSSVDPKRSSAASWSALPQQ